ncbi:hypothetical protein [Pseudomonas fluorescens]|uniref:hypothetical protein n=1 Tax=Pseudomonas fluorescens TaxID=294 RepID=UPI0005AC3BE5|nr:hypothetical protein [Pseudomonas fluorescens]
MAAVAPTSKAASIPTQPAKAASRSATTCACRIRATEQAPQQSTEVAQTATGRRTTLLTRRALAPQQLFKQIAGVHDVILKH